jgi:hypothetical protein
MKMMSMVVVTLLAGPAAAFAQEEGVRGTWSATFSGGASLPAGGEFHEGGSGTVLGLATSVDAKTNGDVFDPGIGWRAGVGYGVARRVELFADFSWTRTSASELSVGNVASLDLRAAFGDYTSYGMDGGMRYHFAPGANVNPYVTALAGFRRVEEIPATLSVPAAGVTLRDTPFFDNSIVPVFGGGVGVLFAVSPRLSSASRAGCGITPTCRRAKGWRAPGSRT